MLQSQSMRFQNISNGHKRILGCLNRSNLVITNVAKFVKYQPSGVSNHLSFVESIKIEKEKGVCHIKLSQLV